MHAPFSHNLGEAVHTISLISLLQSEVGGHNYAIPFFIFFITSSFVCTLAWEHFCTWRGRPVTPLFSFILLVLESLALPPSTRSFDAGRHIIDCTQVLVEHSLQRFQLLRIWIHDGCWPTAQLYLRHHKPLLHCRRNCHHRCLCDMAGCRSQQSEYVPQKFEFVDK